MKQHDILLVYDHQCSICDTYCRRVHIRETEGELHLVNARLPGRLMEEVTASGLDIDQGLVLKIDSDLYYGSEAIHRLSLLSDAADPFNWLTYWTFHSQRLAHILYPILRSAHNLLLKIQRKSKVNNLGNPGNDKY